MTVGHSRLLSHVNINDALPVEINKKERVDENMLLILGLRMTNTLSWLEKVSYVHKKSARIVKG